jgi:hypothetical protein
MSTRLVAFLLVGALSFAPAAVAFEAPADADLEEGIRPAQLGDFEKAVITLDGVARRLAAEGGRSRDLARAYVYLSISYLGLSQEQKAKAQFLEALKADTEMQLDEGEFPPRILEFFEAAREEAVAEGVAEPSPVAPVTGPPAAEPAAPEPVAEGSTPAPEPEKKGGSKTLLLIGGGAAAAAGIALAAGGGGGGGGGGSAPAPAPAPEPVVQWIEVFSSEVPREIPDQHQAFSQLTVRQTGTIQEAYLEFRIRHTCRGDLWMELRHPDGITYEAEAPGDCQELWEGPLGFDAAGRRAHGVWTLPVMDRYEEDARVLETWGGRLRTQG